MFYYINQRHTPYCGIGLVKTESDIITPFYKKEIARKSISYLGSKIWNDLNQDIKSSPSANSFKHAIMRHFFKS